MRVRLHYLGLVLMLFLTFIATISCRSSRKKSEVLFETLTAEKTGLNFSNDLKAKPDFNMLKYMYFYNGAGVAAADFNNDNKVDLFFASNQGQNKMYINKGDLQFEDVTGIAKIPNDGGWSTGVSVADVNDDGLLDIYVCRVGHYESLQSKNQLLICKGVDPKGVPHYADEAASYGLDFSGFSTQAAFLDYDLDGDLDMFLLNHSLRYNSTFAPRKNFEQTTDSLSGDILFRNDNGRFTDVSKQAGILQSVIGYGLGVAVADVNLDGWPDMYIGNDFHENDYLYINNKKGGFTEELTTRTMHTSQFSMGVDVADINNDAWPEIIAADMLPSDPYILRRSLGEDEYNTFQIKIRNGYNHQYARNTLQLNRGNGLFSEVGLYSGIYATDWSWSTLWMDFDNDGLKDLFISNGIPKRLNDIDYVNYVSNDEIQLKIRSGQMGEKDMALIDKFPQIKLPNRFFINKGDARFEDAGQLVSNNSNTYSNGAAYADFDNDGDLDVVVNNIDEKVLLYKNKANDAQKRPSVQLHLKGLKGNRNAVGAKAIIFTGNKTHVYEKFPVKGFQSAMEVPLQFALPSKFDSVLLIWPDNHYQQLNLKSDSSLTISYQPGLPVYAYQRLQQQHKQPEVIFEDITASYGITHLHKENLFVEFDREPLMPFMVSQEGPALAVADINGDKLDDFFIGSVKWEKSAVYIQQGNGRFIRTIQPALEKDSTYEDTDATWIDVNKDGYTDLLVASGGNEYYGNSQYLLPRLYLNNENGILVRKDDAFANDVLVTASCILAHDFTGDGLPDLFLGGRAIPFQYGAIPRSYILQNTGTGQFKDITASLSSELLYPGLVKDAKLADADKDGDMDLLLALDWGPIAIFSNEKGGFIKKYSSAQKGWWNFILPFDVDGDGDMDFIAGNQGLNSRLKASNKEPVRLYYFDADNNGKKEQILSYYLNGEELPFANKAELEKQIPSLKKKYLYAEDFARASLKNIFSSDKLNKAEVYNANYFYNAVFVNDGNFSYTVKELPWQAQLTQYRDGVTITANEDDLPDVLLAGNFYANNIQMGRYDADYGTVLVNRGGGKFECANMAGFALKGETRKIKKINTAKAQQSFIAARNNDSLLLIRKK